MNVIWFVSDSFRWDHIANPGDPVRSVDDFLRMLQVPTVTTITAGKWSLIYSIEEGISELYDLMRIPNRRTT